MKVIKSRYKPPSLDPQSWKIVCTGCRSILEATAEDVEYAEWGAYCETPERRYYVPCPLCGTDNFVSPVTDDIRRLARPYIDPRA